VDRVIEALRGGSLLPVLGSFEALCTAPDGFVTSGRRPLCRTGEAAGTIVSWFLVVGVEGDYYRADEAREVVAQWPPARGRLYAVYEAGPDEQAYGAQYVLAYAWSPDVEYLNLYYVNTSGVSALFGGHSLREGGSFLIPPPQ
jgi:hypothetical protein